jgi:flagellar biogenesis protein FliO
VSVLIGLTLASALALVWLKRRGQRDTGGMRVLGRLALEPRRAIYLVEVGGRCFMIGVGDGPMTMLAEVERPPPLSVVAGGRAS